VPDDREARTREERPFSGFIEAREGHRKRERRTGGGREEQTLQEEENRGGRRKKTNQGSREREDWRGKNSEGHWPANAGAPTSSPVAPPPSPSEQTNTKKNREHERAGRRRAEETDLRDPKQKESKKKNVEEGTEERK
jgi:hypothetical protein